MAGFMGVPGVQPGPERPPKWKVLPARMRNLRSSKSRPSEDAPVDEAPSVAPPTDERPRPDGYPTHRPGPRGGEDYRMLTTEQAYRALYHFVAAYQQRSGD